MARHNPYPALFVVALVPALLIGGVWKLADRLQPPEIDVSANSGPVAAPNPLTTPLLSVRRAPEVLARDALGTRFKDSLVPLLNSLGDSACLDISIDGQSIASKNESLSLRPASNIKLITAAVALDVLGADYRYTTLVQGDVDAEGVVRGNLYLVGSGDPLLSSWWWLGPNTAYPPINKTTIDELADLVVAAGVTRVNGSVVGDATKYDDEWYPATWTEDVHFTEGGPISALLVNDGRESPTKASTNPVTGAARVFTTLLEDKGIKVEGEGKSGRSSSTTTIATIRSNPLPLIIQEMLTTSDNNTAEMLLKEIGIVAGGSGTTAAGLNVVISKRSEETRLNSSHRYISRMPSSA
jgi:D-alanyl-D-alanine carboxypeptidase/D-alanyl-D-alanine-endopeptidase (penicillin-binding protein 4)